MDETLPAPATTGKRSAFRRWFFGFVYSTALLSSGAFGGWFLAKPARPAKTPKVFAVIKLHPPANGTETRTHRSEQSLLVRSRPVLLAALRRQELSNLEVIRRQANPVAWLEANLQIDFLEDTNLMRVGLSGSEPQDLVAVVQTIAETYIQEVAAAERRLVVAKLTVIEKLYDERVESRKLLLMNLARVAKDLRVKPGEEPAELQVLRETMDRDQKSLQQLHDHCHELRLRRRLASDGPTIWQPAQASFEEAQG